MKEEVSRSFNLNELKLMSNGDEKFIKEMIRVFIKSTEEGVNRIEKALKDKNYKAIASEVHKIASPCRHMGALDLLGILKKLESNLQTSGSVEDLQNLVKQTREKLDVVVTELKEENM